MFARVGDGGSCQGALVEVREQLWESVCSFCCVGSGHQTQLIKLGAKHLSPLKATSPAPTCRLLSSECVCVHISALWTYSTPGQENLLFSFPLCPCLCHFSSLLPKLVTRQLAFSAVGPWAGSQQPRPVLEGEKNGQRLVLVVELNEGWKLLC